MKIFTLKQSISLYSIFTAVLVSAQSFSKALTKDVFELRTLNMIPSSEGGPFIKVEHQWFLEVYDNASIFTNRPSFVKRDEQDNAFEALYRMYDLIGGVGSDVSLALQQATDLRDRCYEQKLIDENQYLNLTTAATDAENNNYRSRKAKRDDRLVKRSRTSGGISFEWLRSMMISATPKSCHCEAAWMGNWKYMICSHTSGSKCDTTSSVNTIAEAYERGFQDASNRDGGAFCFCMNNRSRWAANGKFIHNALSNVISLDSNWCDSCHPPVRSN